MARVLAFAVLLQTTAALKESAWLRGVPQEVISNLQEAAIQLSDDGVQGWLASNRGTHPLTTSLFERIASDVKSAVNSGDEGKQMDTYGMMQALMSRVFEVQNRYSSLNALYASLGAGATVEAFQKLWQSLGTPKHEGTNYELLGEVYKASGTAESNMAKMVDADGSGTISKDELGEFLLTCIELSTNMLSCMTNEHIVTKTNTYHEWAEASTAALALKRASLHGVPQEVMANLKEASVELVDDGVQAWLASNRGPHPMMTGVFEQISSDVKSALTSGNEEEQMDIYGMMQAMMSRVYEVKDNYQSLNAFHASLGGGATTEAFQQAWQRLGTPKHAGTDYELLGKVYEASGTAESRMAKMVDADSSGTVSKEELEEFLHACIELSTNMLGDMTNDNIVSVSNTYPEWAEA